MLINADHYDLTAWIFFGVIACLIVSLVIALTCLKIVFQTRNVSSKRKKNKKKISVKSKSESNTREVTESCDKSKGQYLGFLKDKTNQLGKRVTFTIPSNCLHCDFLVKCQGIKTKKNLFKKLLPLVVVFAFFMSTYTYPLVAADATSDLIAETPLTVFGEHEWVHVRVAGEQVGSVAWEGYDSDVQLVFYAYNDSGLSFDQFVIEPKRSYSDPFNKYKVYWNGTKNTRDELMLKFYSFQGQTTTVVEAFAGEVPHYGRPGTRVTKTVITREKEIFDVFSDKDNKHLCSFEWSYISRTSNVTNETESTPSLVVYDPDGTKYDNRWLSATMLPLVEYWDLVGFMVDSMGVDYVKWILYSDNELQVRLTQGFEGMSLTYFNVEPVGLRVQPGDIVSVSFVLPEDVADYDVSWTRAEIWDHITLLRDEVVDGEHIVEFKFSESILSSKNSKDVTVMVECEKYGTSYSGSAVVRVMRPDYSMGIFLVALIPVGIVLLFGLRWLLGRMREHASGAVVTGEWRD